MTKIIARYDRFVHPPILTLHIHGAPHKRMHRAILQQYREDMYAAAIRGIGSEVDLPIDHPIDLVVYYTNPSSSDLDHLLEATYQALDGKSLKGPSVLVDDKHIQKVTMSKMYIGKQTKRDSQR